MELLQSCTKPPLLCPGIFVRVIHSWHGKGSVIHKVFPWCNVIMRSEPLNPNNNFQDVTGHFILMLMNWSYCSFGLSHWYHLISKSTFEILNLHNVISSAKMCLKILTAKNIKKTWIVLHSSQCKLENIDYLISLYVKRLCILVKTGPMWPCDWESVRQLQLTGQPSWSV